MRATEVTEEEAKNGEAQEIDDRVGDPSGDGVRRDVAARRGDANSIDELMFRMESPAVIFPKGSPKKRSVITSEPQLKKIVMREKLSDLNELSSREGSMSAEALLQKQGPCTIVMLYLQDRNIITI